MSNPHWHLTGNTLVTDRYIRLTSDSQSKAGGLWNTLPIIHPDWEIQVQFKIHGASKNLFGDGFVIWYVRDPKLSGKNNDYFIINQIDKVIHLTLNLNAELKLISSFSSHRSCFWLSRLF